MASKRVQASTTVVIPVELKAAANDFKQLTDAAEQALKNVRLDSSTGKRLARELRNAQLAQSRYETAVSGSSVSAKELTQINKYATQVQSALEKISFEFNHMDTGSLSLSPTELNSWKKAQGEITKCAQAVNDAKSGIATVSQLFNTSEMQKFASSGVKSTMQLKDAIDQAKTYYDSMVEKANKATAATKAATTEYQNLKKAAKEAGNVTTSARADLNAAQEERKNTSKRTTKSYQQEALNQILGGKVTDKRTASGKIFSALGSAQSMSGKKDDKINYVFQEVFASAFTQDKKGHTRVTPSGKNAIGYVLQAMGLDDAAISNIQNNAKERIQLIRTAIDEAIKKTPIESYSQQALNAALPWSDAEEMRQRLIGQADANVKTKTAAFKAAETKEKQAIKSSESQVVTLQKLQSDETKANANVAVSKQTYDTLLAKQANMQNEITRLESELAAAQQQLDQLQQQFQQQYGSSGAEVGAQARATARGVETKTTAGKEEIKAGQEAESAADLAAAETEQFQKNMQASIKRWFGFQQIVNIVRGGIQQAYHDIQALDKAMTNIAVVTDMSVDDLWGKIDQYMGIAQQYGVTTQGVYEVSQLFYQQGT